MSSSPPYETTGKHSNWRSYQTMLDGFDLIAILLRLGATPYPQHDPNGEYDSECSLFAIPSIARFEETLAQYPASSLAKLRYVYSLFIYFVYLL